MVTELPHRLIIDHATRCNLRCPMCPVWGQTEEDINTVKGIMNVERSRKILDEVMSVKPLVQPVLYGEPLLIPDLENRITDMKNRGIAIAMNTNGLTLDEKTAEMFVHHKVDSVFVSIDAVTRETLMAIRGIDKLEKIETAVFRLLTARGKGDYPRIGVSFTKQKENAHEEVDFVERWVGAVDCVRIGLVFLEGQFPDMVTPKERIPCPALYKTMAIHNDGQVTVCCLDGLKQTNMGNVFERGVKDVWHGPEFTAVRTAHEEGRWDDVPFCAGCNGWTQHLYEEHVVDDILIRKSPEFIYYNKISRSGNWKGSLLGGHETEMR